MQPYVFALLRVLEPSHNCNQWKKGMFLCCYCSCMCCSFVIAAYVVALLRITVAPAQAEHGMFLHVFSPLTVGATFGDPVILK